MADQQRAVVQPCNRRGPEVDARRGIGVGDLHQALLGVNALLRARLRTMWRHLGPFERRRLGVVQVMHQLQKGGDQAELGGTLAPSASTASGAGGRRQVAARSDPQRHSGDIGVYSGIAPIVQSPQGLQQQSHNSTA